jgi:Zn-dependent peptidase ImmA (M78 family)
MEETIPFDIVINFNIPFMRVIIKCFNDDDNMTLNNIKNFYNQKEEVSAQKVIIVSSTSFNSNIINYSKKKNGDISLLYFPNSFKNINWTLERKSTIFIEIKEKKPKFIIDLFPKNENNLLSNYKLISKKKLNQVTFIDDNTIDKIVLNLLSRIGYQNGMVDLNKIILLLKNENKIYTKYNQSLEENVLGEINFKKSMILIDNHQCKTLARIRFTLAHEIAHFLLGHSRYMLGEKHTIKEAKCIDNELFISVEEIMKIEFQANRFASFLLLPTKSFLKDIHTFLTDYDIKDRGVGLFFVDNQRCNTETYLKITSQLMHRYKVSRQVIELRLKNLKILHKKDTYEIMKNIHQGITNKKINWNHHD